MIYFNNSCEFLMFLLFFTNMQCLSNQNLRNIQHSSNFTEISYAQAELLYRIKAASYVNVPYRDLKSSQGN